MSEMCDKNSGIQEYMDEQILEKKKEKTISFLASAVAPYLGMIALLLYALDTGDNILFLMLCLCVNTIMIMIGCWVIWR